jgi:hypothetical protein
MIELPEACELGDLAVSPAGPSSSRNDRGDRRSRGQQWFVFKE